MGENTEGMVESTSKLRDYIKGITGFDIMEDEETFKSIYEIIVGIGEKWNELSDIEQAGLLEKLAGKTQANTLASALNNIDTLKEAYNSAQESAGSAMTEQAHFEEGIQYSINQLNASIEALSHTLIDSGLLKFFVDLGTTGVNAIDKLVQKMTAIPAIITGIVGAMSFIKGQNFFTKPVDGAISLFSNANRLTASQNPVGKLGYAKSFVGNVFSGMSTPAEITNANAIINTLQNNGIDFGMYQPTIEELQQVSQQLGIVGDEAAKTAQQMINMGAVSGQAGQAGAKSFKNFGKILEGIGKTALSIGTTMLVSFALNEAFKAYDNYLHKFENSKKGMEEAKTSADEKKKDIESLSAQLKEVQDRLVVINSIDGAKLAKDGEKEKLEAQSKELERQIALKEASLRLDAKKAYNESNELMKSTVETHDAIDVAALRAGESREEYIRNRDLHGVSSGKSRMNIKQAVPAELEYYRALVEERKNLDEQVTKLSTDEDGKYSKDIADKNADAIEAINQKIDDNTELTDQSRETLVEWSNTLSDAASNIKDYEDFGHILTEDDRATIELAESTKTAVDAMADAIIAGDGVSDSQEKIKNSVIKTSEQLSAQKSTVDGLISTYKELFELSTRGDGLDVVLDDEQLKKYGNALEYVNGNYKLNTEKLFELAEAHNQEQIALMKHDKEMANMKYLQNIRDIEIYTNMLKEGKKVLEDGKSIKKHIADLQNDNKAIIEQNKVVEYQISQLENVTSAYQKWLAVSGQDVDAKAFTGVQDASKSILDLLSKGKIGLDSYKMAVDFVIPEEVSSQGEVAIQKYVKDLQKYFTEDKTGIDKFMTESSYFEGDAKNGFTLKEGTSVADIAKEMNWTVEVTRAMIDQLETYGGEFKWNIEGMYSDTDKLVHYQEALAEINKERETFNMDDLSTADQERLTELNKQADNLLEKIKEVQAEIDKTTFDKTNKTVDQNGGVQKLYQTYSWMKDNGMETSEITEYITQNTGLKSEQEIKLYTDEAQRNVDALKTKLQELGDSYDLGEISKEEYETEYQKVTTELQEQGLMVEMLNEVLLEDAGVSTEETVSNIASILETISGLVSTIAERTSENKPEEPTATGGDTKKPAPTYKEVKQNTFTEPVSTKSTFKDSVTMKVDADTAEFDSKVKESNTLADMLNTPRKMPVSASGLSGVNSELSRADRLARVLTGKTHVINFEYKVTGNPPTVPNTGTGGAKGNAFARGNDIVGEQGRELVVDPHKGIWYTVGNSGTEMINLPKDAIIYSHNQTEALLKSGVTSRGKSTGRSFADGSLVDERGRELIVDPNNGIWYTVGDNGSEMINLPKDAIVYNHQQTEDLLKNGHTGRGHSTGASFASGNAYARNTDSNVSGSVPGTVKTYTGGGASSQAKAAKSAEKAAKSAEEAAKNAKKDADEAKETIDWIERALEYQNREIKKWKDVMDDDYEPYSNRFKALGEYKEQLLEQEEVLTEALNRRNEKFEEDSKKLTDAIGEEKASVIIERVLKGDVDPGEWLQKFQEEFGEESGEKIYKIVVDLQTDQKNIESTKDDIYENGKAIRDAIQEAYKMQLNIIKAAKDDLDYEMDVLEHNLDMKDVLGKMVVEADYQEMIDLTDDMVDNLQEQKATLEEQLDTLEEGSQEWYNCKQEINSVNKELMECEKNQAEWNDKIMRLPIERLDRYIGMLENIKKDLQNWISERDTLNISTLGKTIGEQYKIAQEQIDAYQKKEKMYLDLMKNYEYGSEKFHETADEIQSCQDSVSSLIQEMEELNMQFLKLPIDNISKANEKLQNINAAEQRVLDDYDTALSAVLSKFDKLIDDINEKMDDINKQYDERIEKVQDELDLLNEQNEAKQMQYNIDKAQYDLDKARQQKNIQVVRNGRIEYDSDIDAIKNAQDSLNDAQHDKAIYNLQQKIDLLEKQRDAELEPLEKNVEALEKSRNRWQTFEDERTFEKEAAEAVRLLGANWEKAIEGTKINPHSDDREYDIFSKGHIELDRQITANEKQIEANERMIDLMTRYADAFLSGEMTYEEAVAQYTKLYNDYQSGGALVSQESLAAELAFNKANNMANALTGNNAITKEQYDSFLGQLKTANDQKLLYEGYQKSWVDMKKSIDEQLAELKRLAELAEQIAKQRRSSGGHSGGDDDGDSGEWSRNPTGYGAGTKYNPNGKGTLYVGGGSGGDFGGASIVEIADRPRSSSGGDGSISVKADKVSIDSKDTELKDNSSSGKSHRNHSSASGPASDPDLKHHADGLAGGMIGNLPASEKFKKLQAMGLKPLEPNEVPAFLHVGEGVVNAIQQGNILQSVANAFKSGVASAIPADAVRSVENNYHIDCTFGDFNLPGVQDVNGFADAMKNNFESIMNQQFSKMF